MNSTVTVNQNVAECLKSTFDFGSITVHNICAGTTSVVPWGALDYIGVSMLIGLGGLILLFMLGGLVAFVRELFWW